MMFLHQNGLLSHGDSNVEGKKADVKQQTDKTRLSQKMHCEFVAAKTKGNLQKRNEMRQC